MTHTQKLMVRWSFLLTLAVAAFLGMWRMMNGSVPQDPFYGTITVSHWWTLIGLPPSACMLAWQFVKYEDEKRIRPYYNGPSFLTVYVLMWLAADLLLNLKAFIDFNLVSICFFLVYKIMALIMFSACWVLKHFLIPFSKKVTGSKIWPAAKIWLLAKD